MTKIENEKQYQAMMMRIEELLPLVDETTPLDDNKSIELVMLSNLVADYDEEHFPMNSPSLPDVLKLKMYELNISQKALAKLLQVSPSRISEYISGKSEPTLKVARLMCKNLLIDPTTVLGI